MRDLLKLTVFGLCLIMVLVGIALMTRATPYDDTDPPGGRSGLVLLTDNPTGCQYLSTSRGGIVPRFNGTGEHVGCR